MRSAPSIPKLEPARLTHELVRRLITRMIEDVMRESQARLADFSPHSSEDLRLAARQMVDLFQPRWPRPSSSIKGFLYPRMYRHPRIMHVMNDAETW